MRKIITILILFSTIGLKAQDINSHQWKDRVILIIANEEENKKLKEQLSVFQNEKDGLQDRKIVLYQVLPKKYKIGFNTNDWKNGAALYKKYNATEANFSVVLIGLDGGVKLSQSKILSAEKLFKTIDRMPMRRAEMREKEKKN